MQISDVRHQDRAHRVLQLALSSNRVPHAYIFHGPSGVGREMLALRLARVMLCGSRGRSAADEGGLDLGIEVTDACGKCDDCKLMEAETHPDLHLIHRQLGALHPDQAVRNRQGLELMVQVIRHFVVDQSMLKSVQGRGKVFVVREAERMSTEAQNALLKTLEEPPCTATRQRPNGSPAAWLSGATESGGPISPGSCRWTTSGWRTIGWSSTTWPSQTALPRGQTTR